jgi:hypothetical protein
MPSKAITVSVLRHKELSFISWEVGALGPRELVLCKPCIEGNTKGLGEAARLKRFHTFHLIYNVLIGLQWKSQDGVEARAYD